MSTTYDEAILIESENLVENLNKVTFCATYSISTIMTKTNCIIGQ